MSKIDLYYAEMSAPCRAVLMTANMIGVELNLKPINLMAGESMTPEFLKMNPQHTIPTMDDNGFILYESRAICGYLIQKYTNDDSLYPKEPKQRAIVDQRLYFDLNVFYKSFMDCYYPVFFFAKPFVESTVMDLEKAVGYLDLFLSQHRFVAGDHLTIADICLVASASTMEAFDEKIFNKSANIKGWLERCRKSIKNYQSLNQEGATQYGQMTKMLWNKNHKQ